MTLDDKITALEQQHARWLASKGYGEVVSLERYRRAACNRRVEAALAEANAELNRLERILPRYPR